MMLAVRIAVLAALFAIFTDPAAAANWLLGLAAGTAIAPATGGRGGIGVAASAARLARLPRLAVGAGRRIAAGAWTMLAIIAGRRGWESAGLVACPDCADTEAGLVVLGLIESASPGSLTVAIDVPRRTLLVHTVDAGDPEATCAAVRRFYRRYQHPVLP